VRKAIWTLVTQPPDLAIAARPDDNVAQAHIQLFMPLFLQLVSKQADVRPVIRLQALLLWYNVSATANAISVPCRSACMRGATERHQADAFGTSIAQAGLPGQET